MAVPLTRAEIARAERDAERLHGIPAAVLMENAGRAAATLVLSRLPALGRPRVTVVCGRGNNGGDGYVAARVLAAAGLETAVVACGFPPPERAAAFTNLLAARKIGVCVVPADADAVAGLIAPADAVLDALFGTGVSGPLRGPEARLVSAMNAAAALRVSLDIPSGLTADDGRAPGPAVRAHVTVSFGFVKRGFFVGRGPELCGAVVCADIGFPPSPVGKRTAPKDA